MGEEILWTLLVWSFRALFLVCLIVGLLDHDNDWRHSKAYKDLRETTLNREDKD